MENPDFSEKNLLYDVNYQIKEATETLRIAFGVENLSNIELFHLRKITEDVLQRAERDNPRSDFAIINPQEEISQRFLSELYGVDYDHLHRNAKTEEDREGFVEYIGRLRDQAHLI